MSSEKKIFIDRFDNVSYTISKYDGADYTPDIAVVHNYKSENPHITFTSTHPFSDIQYITSMVSKQQEDVNIFENIASELNSVDK
jgi:hypothetical protein